ncbi:DNA-binding protein inhibitor ID-3 [Chanodichthys erythropterus]|uniref:DNA-binding protein inhibitor ID-3 n=1 Tax=Chanodichthys erythropterus TaxID=933992 RepID=UPI00351DBD73
MTTRRERSQILDIYQTGELVHLTVQTKDFFRHLYGWILLASQTPDSRMKAISPVRSVRSCYEAVCCISEQSLAISRCKSPSEELSDMNDCYSKLKELVPSIPQNKSVSQVEILQHVIDYIFDLQIALENETDSQNTPDMFMSMKNSEMTRNFSKEDGAMCH